MLLSNHFKFKAKNFSEKIYIYKIDFGIFSSEREDCFSALRSI